MRDSWALLQGQLPRAADGGFYDVERNASDQCSIGKQVPSRRLHGMVFCGVLVALCVAGGATGVLAQDTRMVGGLAVSGADLTRRLFGTAISSLPQAVVPGSGVGRMKLDLAPADAKEKILYDMDQQSNQLKLNLEHLRSRVSSMPVQQSEQRTVVVGAPSAEPSTSGETHGVISSMLMLSSSILLVTYLVVSNLKRIGRALQSDNGTSLLASGGAAALTAGSALAARPAAIAVRSRSVQMVAVPTADFTGSVTGEEQVNFKVAKAGAYVVQRKVVAEQANMRHGTVKVKTRAEVRGGGRKPYQQKGTGRARRGSTRSPLLVGGGRSFGPRPKSWAIKMNRKEKRLAISTALMSAAARMVMVEDFEGEFSGPPKTKLMQGFLERLGSDLSGKSNTMMLIKERHENTYLSARNIPFLNLKTLDNINARDILRAKKLVISKSAMEDLKERYGNVTLEEQPVAA